MKISKGLNPKKFQDFADTFLNKTDKTDVLIHWDAAPWRHYCVFTRDS